MGYRKRFYRNWQNPDGLVSFSVRCRETDLMVYAEKNLAEKALVLVRKYRSQIEATIKENPCFSTSLIPLEVKTPYRIITEMVDKSRLAGVGPMAGVAGAIAEFTGRELLEDTEGIIVENGGDVFIRSRKDRTVLVYAGEESPFRDRVRILLRGREEPFGVCTSSRTIGHSKSFGNTDAVVVVASSAVTADVFATAVGNRVKRPDDLEPAIEYVRSFPDISGLLIMIGDRMAVSGEIELV
ncbi:MAG: UPF0280 family protein [Spirochaetes bacterium]|nr:UPF0280 family protein [Spirochaetota bacterium]